MKKHKYLKKEYKGGILDIAFTGGISTSLVLAPNLISRTLNISTELLYFAEVFVILFWNIVIYIKLSIIKNNISLNSTLISKYTIYKKELYANEKSWVDAKYNHISWYFEKQ
jgi:hypothetical protein